MTRPVAGVAEPVAPLVRRILAPNPSPFTHWGTNSYMIGRDAPGAGIAILDPGPDDAAHVAALRAAADGRRVEAVIVTHSHRDHSPAARALCAATGAPLLGGPAIRFDPDAAKADAGFDPDYAPDRLLRDGERIAGDGWVLETVATPGHASNHLCFALDAGGSGGAGETGAGRGLLFSGDHVMGWSTTVVIPPDGDMAAYMRSLERLLERDEALYLPGHGPAVERPRRLVRGQLGHRKAREGQVMRLLEAGVGTVPAMVARMYVGLDPRLVPAAGLSVLAHLIDLGGQGRARQVAGGWEAAG